MQETSTVFVGLDTSKLKISVALAEEGRQGEVRFLGDIDNTPDAMKRLVRKLSGKYLQLLFCYEAGPTGYGLHRQITALGHDCSVIAPSLIPKRSGEHVKTNRRDALTLARLHRAGELTTIWVPDLGHEAIRGSGAGTRSRHGGFAREAPATAILSPTPRATVSRSQVLDAGARPLAV
jgi:transposase